ncbi:hypothetical protein KSP40_PGU020499 [Platanthera guangdongensis]|uniref:Uncharacterized protein n=1 Tax=Platanthera guangdongensis TaxID=2320717 RepID=A0ABR2M5Q7_9ASPA
MLMERPGFQLGAFSLTPSWSSRLRFSASRFSDSQRYCLSVLLLWAYFFELASCT